MAERIHEGAHEQQPRTKLIHEGRYAAEIGIELLVTDDEWSPIYREKTYTNIDDVATLKKGDTATAARNGRILL
jgi:hypothetical protein